MPLLTRSVQTPLNIDVRRGAIATLGELLHDRRISARGDVAVVVGPGLGEQIAALLAPTLGNAEIIFTTGGTLESALELGAKLRGRNIDAVVGIGGGKTIDTTKYAASRYGIPMVSVATSLANDGICSPTASLDHEGGRGSYGVHIPLAAVIDLDFVESGPDSQSRAGIGETLSNLNAIADWELAARAIGEPIDGIAVAMARSGAEALINHPGDLGDDGFLTVLAESLIMGGLAMAVSGTSRPASGGCHEISHAIDILYPGVGSHGTQCGVGALFCTFLRGEDARFAQLSATMRRHEVPRSPADLGLGDDQFAEIVRYAPRTRPERYTILEHIGIDHLAEREVNAMVADYVGAINS
ncbi:glycerol-1-phosphate dehydrogenase [NAD(P)+] [Allocatelliglobosispora scoriae]|uniref:Glycerol-1-phosphate dehydrogenase [NAD(P)+] n=1 Tax=Allocatelliglobosispora scoriae TaxID=643052 RepID=A0A841BWN4_9ACTN|nr:iron-containing alcohol dehydrogenase family protein [Allocatelliglobosispora scoriae]MBB5871131.1 glycerol-1-phosphate dehydrogenase [NAD(P)+] [Allocatelliglobosispora scoriae]